MRRPPVLLFSALFVATATADCFSHDGIAALNSKFYTGPELVSCGNSTNNCCLQGQKCGSNLLCVDSDGDSSRQYCAVANWEGCSTLCPQNTGAGVFLRDCGDNIFCCNGNSDDACCDTEGEHFFVDPDTGDVKDPSKGSATTSGIWWTVDSSALLAATSASSSSASSSPASTPSSSPAETTAASTDTPTNTPEPEKDDKLSAGAAAGIAIGAVAGVALVVAGVWLLLRRKKKSKAVAAQELGADGYGQQPYAGGYPPSGKHEQDVYAHAPGTAPGATPMTGPQELSGETRHELS